MITIMMKCLEKCITEVIVLEIPLILKNINEKVQQRNAEQYIAPERYQCNLDKTI